MADVPHGRISELAWGCLGTAGLQKRPLMNVILHLLSLVGASL